MKLEDLIPVSLDDRIVEPGASGRDGRVMPKGSFAMFAKLDNASQMSEASAIGAEVSGH